VLFVSVCVFCLLAVVVCLLFFICGLVVRLGFILVLCSVCVVGLCCFFVCVRVLLFVLVVVLVLFVFGAWFVYYYGCVVGSLLFGRYCVCFMRCVFVCCCSVLLFVVYSFVVGCCLWRCSLMLFAGVRSCLCVMCVVFVMFVVVVWLRFLCGVLLLLPLFVFVCCSGWCFVSLLLVLLGFGLLLILFVVVSVVFGF
jgi:hypothetical protein